MHSEVLGVALHAVANEEESDRYDIRNLLIAVPLIAILWPLWLWFVSGK